MSDEVTRLTAESLAGRSVSREHYDWMVQNRNEWQQKAEALGGAAQRMTLDNCRLVAERDAAMVDLKQDVRSLVALVDYDCAERLQVERDAARAERDAAEEKCRKLHAENEGMRADALARPPEYDRTLAIERKRHSKLLDDYNLQATMIETLQEALKRTEAMLAKAQAQHIDDRLKGFLSVISQLADQAQDLLP